MTRNPCYLCEDRYVGCHGKCESYKAWRAEYDEMKKKEREHTDTQNFVYAVFKNRNDKTKRYRKHILHRGSKP